MTKKDYSNILVVDDSPSALEMITSIIDNEGVRIATARSGDAALKKVKTIPFDLILMDILMPEMDGFEVIRQLRNNKATRDIPILIITARDDELSVLEGFEQGAIDYVTKPFREAELRARVNNVLELRRSREELVKARVLAEKHSRAKSEFLANMSHEIRTPISGILGVVDIFRKTDLDQYQMELMDIIESSTDLLLTIINDILDLSKIEEGKMKLEKIAFNLKKEVNDVIALFGKKAQEKGLNLHVSFDPGIPDAVVGDPVRFKQVLMNLVSNSLKFTAEGSISVRLRVELKEEKNIKIFCEVEDTGIGISEEGQKRLFETFSQVDDSTTRLYGGSGLGLTISRNLVHMMHGQIGVESDPGKGSRFYFTVILSTADGGAASQQQMSSEELRLLKDRDIRLLLVEDNPVNQKVSELMLRDWNVEVSIAGNGKQAVSMYQEVKPDIIFMDVQMPLMDGYEATEMIRNIEKQNDMKPAYIVAVTASVTSGDRKRSLEAGMDEYITKPFTKEDLVRMMNLFLKKQD